MHAAPIEHAQYAYIQPARECQTQHQIKNSVYCEIQRDLSGSDRLNQHCVNSFGKGLNVTDVHLYVNVPHCRFKE